MNKREYILELRRELERLPFDERENAVGYYEEYFDEAGPQREQEVVTHLGTPKYVAQQIMADYVAKDIQQPVKTPKEGFSKIWLVVLAIFASPIAAAVAITVAAVAFALVVVVLALIFSFGAVSLALLVSGILCVITAFCVIASGFSTFLYFAGGGIAMIGTGILMGYLTYFTAIKMTGAIARWLGRFLKKRKVAAAQ